MLERFSIHPGLLKWLQIIGAVASIVGVVLTLIGTTKIVMSPTLTNWVAIATFVFIWAWAKLSQKYKELQEIRKYRYKVLKDRQTLTFSPGARSGNKISPVCRLSSERECLALHDFAFSELNIQRFFSEKTSKSEGELRGDYQAFVICEELHSHKDRVSANVEFQIPALRPYWAKVKTPAEMKAGNCCTFIEELTLPNDFSQDRERFTFGIATPTKHRDVKLVFVGLDVKEAWAYKMTGSGQSANEALRIEKDRGTASSRVTYAWHAPSVGEELVIEWNWKLNSEEVQ